MHMKYAGLDIVQNLQYNEPIFVQKTTWTRAIIIINNKNQQ